MKKKLQLTLISMLCLFQSKVFAQFSSSFPNTTTTDYVGIGTASPAAALDIDGNNMSGSTTTGDVFKTNAPSGSDSRWQMFRNGTRYGCLYNKTGENHFRLQAPNASGDIIFETGGGTGSGTERVRVANGGNMSIGNVSAFTAQNLLHLNQSGSTAVYSQFTNGNTGAGASTNGFVVGVDANGNAEIKNQYNNANGNILFSTHNGTSVGERMRIAANGNVGLGTTTSTYLINLSNAAAQTIWIENTGAGTAGSALTVAAGGTIAGGSNDTPGGNLTFSSGAATGTQSSQIQFLTATPQLTSTNTINTPNAKMTILGNGRVGIGVIAPLAPLHIDVGATNSAIFLGNNSLAPHALTGIGFNPAINGIVYGSWVVNNGAGGCVLNGFTNASAGPGAAVATAGVIIHGHLGIINPAAPAIILGGWKRLGTGGNRDALTGVERVLAIRTGNNDLVTVTGNGNVGIGVTNPGAKLSITQTVTTTGALTGIVYTGAINTNQTASTEIPAVTLITAGRQWVTGTLTTQREVLITQPTYSFTGSSTITDAATVGIAGVPIESNHATITNSHALLIQSGLASSSTNSYGLTVNAPTGATNNYAAAFLGGNVGIGTNSPDNLLEITTGINGNSGLRFTNVTRGATTPISPNPFNGVLSVDNDGNVILVEDDATASGGVGECSSGITTNFVVKSSDADEICQSRIFDNNSYIGLGTVRGLRSINTGVPAYVNVRDTNNHTAMHINADWNKSSSLSFGWTRNGVDTIAVSLVRQENERDLYVQAPGAGNFVTFTRTGRVGIGTLTPLANHNLTIAGKNHLMGDLTIGKTAADTINNSLSNVGLTVNKGASFYDGHVQMGTTAHPLTVDPSLASTDPGFYNVDSCQHWGAIIYNKFTNGGSIGGGGGLKVAVAAATTDTACHIFGVYAGDDNSRLYVRGDGHVGIGFNNTHPRYDLDVVGQIRSTSDIWHGGPLHNYSDSRLKKEIQDYDDGLAVIRKLNPVTFKFNGKARTNNSRKPIVGIIAQELAKYAPYLVDTMYEKLDTADANTTAVLAIQSQGLVYTALNAINELDSANTAKDSTINALTNTVANLTGRLNTLEQRLNNCCALPEGRMSNPDNTTESKEEENTGNSVKNTQYVSLGNKNSIILDQNSPNPFEDETTISYYIPDEAQDVKIVFYSNVGVVLKTVEIPERGKGSLHVYSPDLSSGTYLYSIFSDDKLIDTKRMVKQK